MKPEFRDQVLEIPDELKQKLIDNLNFMVEQLNNPTLENISDWYFPALDEIKEHSEQVEKLIPDEAWEL